MSTNSLHFVAIYDYPKNIKPVESDEPNFVKEFYAMDNSLIAYKVTIRESEKPSIPGFAKRITYDISAHEVPVSEIYSQRFIFYGIEMVIDEFSLYKDAFMNKYQEIIDKDFHFIECSLANRPMYGIFYITLNGLPHKGKYANKYGDFVKDNDNLYEIALRGNTWKSSEFWRHHGDIPFIHDPSIVFEMAINAGIAYGIDKSKLTIVRIKNNGDDISEAIVKTIND